ncbi:hypothetical protein RclHR1_01420020 [Rhizophagus clarus]|uniref:Uncharacterized protein n=1 Tax=Rhizophagus clarus TaxID=94130 RepID=A0A2Z6QBY8_9GLOM|nr:hypothetical protein RclHR1_01420020 [Rhizophagus clarus]
MDKKFFDDFERRLNERFNNLGRHINNLGKHLNDHGADVNRRLQDLGDDLGSRIDSLRVNSIVSFRKTDQDLANLERRVNKIEDVLAKL